MIKKVILLCVLPIFLVSGCDSKESGRGSESDATQESIPSEYRGMVATIRLLKSNSLSDSPLQIEHTLTNTAHKSIVIYDLENSIIPLFEGVVEGFGTGPLGEKTTITLKPGESASRSVELTRLKGDEDWSLKVNVRGEGTGFNQMFTSKTLSSKLKFRVGYDDKIFTGKTGDAIAPVLATPWIEIQVE